VGKIRARLAGKLGQLDTKSTTPDMGELMAGQENLQAPYYREDFLIS